MSSRTLIKKAVRRFISNRSRSPLNLKDLDSDALERMEKLIQQELGKGSGAFSTTDEVLAIKSVWGKSRIAPKVIFDVGAHHGEWTDAALKIWPSASFYLFEPAHDLYLLLKKKYTAYQNITVFNLAISKENSESASLYANLPNSGLASLTKRRLDHFDLEFNYSEIVIVRTLRDIMHENDIPRINVLKIDVEGEELNVLHGLQENLTKVDLVQFEFGGCNIDTRTFFQDFWYLLTKHDFSFYRISPRGIVKQDKYDENLETFTTTNYLAANF